MESLFPGVHWKQCYLGNALLREHQTPTEGGEGWGKVHTLAATQCSTCPRAGGGLRIAY